MPTFTSDMGAALSAIDITALTTDVTAYAGVALALFVTMIAIPFGRKMLSTILK